MAAMITFIGTTEETGVNVLTWGPNINLPVGEAVLVDPDDAETVDARYLYEHLLSVAPNHPHFTVGEVTPVKSRRAKGRDDEDDGEDEPANGDYDLSTLPKDWREMHHKRVIALARRLGGEGEDLATRDGAIAYIEEQLALGVPQRGQEEVPF